MPVYRVAAGVFAVQTLGRGVSGGSDDTAAGVFGEHHPLSLLDRTQPPQRTVTGFEGARASLYDAENGTDNTELTAANVPGLVNILGGSSVRFESDSSMSPAGSLGYRVDAVSAQQAFFTPNITPAMVHAVRFAFRVVAISGVSDQRVLLLAAPGASGSNFRLSVTGSNVLRLRDAAVGAALDGPTRPWAPSTTYLSWRQWTPPLPAPSR